MAFKSGKSSWVALDNTAGALTELSPYIDTTGWPQSVDMQDVSAFGTASKAFIPGLTDGDTVSIGGPLDTALYTHVTALKAAQAAGSSTATLTYGPGGSVSTYPKVSAETWVGKIEFKSGVGGRVEWASELQITGAVTNGAW